MIRTGLIFIYLHIGLLSFAQTNTSKYDTSNAAVKFLKNWEKDFLDVGMSIEKDSFRLNDEAKKLILDSQYRQSTYPAAYNWPRALELMKNMELKKAFWHLINLYRTDTAHKILVLQTFAAYDSLVDMEKILINSFYTYALTDPEVCVFKNGKPDIRHPDILEKKFADVKEITAFIVDYRSRRQKALR
ncbi:MAG: hypothetical protein JWO92_458 [Chitinophagaceae bacterium]|nr:hypothetical protein [Chitinophagaceae bacterium]